MRLRLSPAVAAIAAITIVAAGCSSGTLSSQSGGSGSQGSAQRGGTLVMLGQSDIFNIKWYPLAVGVKLIPPCEALVNRAAERLVTISEIDAIKDSIPADRIAG